MARKKEASGPSRRQQMMQAYRMTKKSDPRIGLWMLLAFLLGAAVGFVVFWLLPGAGGIIGQVASIVGGLLLGGLLALLVLGRRAQRAMYSQMEGQHGAAGGALQMLRKGWNVEQAVAVNKQQDVVHRVVGPPGVVLVGEGKSTRIQQLISSERRKHERVLAETPVHELQVGNEEGQVPLRKLVRRLQKMKRQVKPPEITDILQRLKALDAQRSAVGMPKGPVPTNMKGMRQHMRGR